MDNVANTLCMLDNCEYRHTHVHRICSTYFFSTLSVILRTRLNVNVRRTLPVLLMNVCINVKKVLTILSICIVCKYRNLKIYHDLHRRYSTELVRLCKCYAGPQRFRTTAVYQDARNARFIEPTRCLHFANGNVLYAARSRFLCEDFFFLFLHCAPGQRDALCTCT